MKKKILSLFTILLMMIGLFACDNNNNNNGEDPGTGTIANAVVSAVEGMPVQFVLGRAEPDFTKYFTIRDQREDIDVLPSYIRKNDFDMNVADDYNIVCEYRGVNQIRSSATIVVKVIPVDNIAPEILNFQTEYIVDAYSSLSVLVRSIVIVDNVDGIKPVTGDMITGFNEVTTNVINVNYPISLTAIDSSGNSTTINSVIKVVDITAPIIYATSNVLTRVNQVVPFLGISRITDNYCDYEQLIFDYTIMTSEEDGLVTVDDIDFSKGGVYFIIVTAEDTSGNISAPVGYQVIIESGLSFWQIILVINIIGLVMVGVSVIIYFSVTRSKKRRQANE